MIRSKILWAWLLVTWALAVPLRGDEPQTWTEYYALMLNDHKLGHFIEERRAAAGVPR